MIKQHYEFAVIEDYEAKVVFFSEQEKLWQIFSGLGKEFNRKRQKEASFCFMR